MGKLNKDNLRKTMYYLKKNGFKNTLYAVVERMQKKDTDSYTYVAPDEEKLNKQRVQVWTSPITFSVIVPLYHTPIKYFEEMVESLLAQTYPHFQLILLDAGVERAIDGAIVKTVYEEMVESKKDDRLCYHKLQSNEGIAENTNAGIKYVTGEYIALLDHDDLLTPDALYEMAVAINNAKMQGIELQMIYSDEDKCDGEAKHFYEPHYKKEFDLELLMTNNYICHFTALKAELFKELKLRGEFNGAQDYDLVLRVADRFINQEEVICHIPKVLYHWRCHTSSTASNPASKFYAYEAGKKAVEDFVKRRGWNAQVEHLKHLGFYRVVYEESVFDQRSDVGAVGGSLLGKDGRIVGGMCDLSGHVVYEGLKKGFSGYMNRAALVQTAEALDIRCMMIHPKCEAILLESLQKIGWSLEDYKSLQTNYEQSGIKRDITEISLQISKDLAEAGYRLVWDPQWNKRLQ